MLAPCTLAAPSPQHLRDMLQAVCSLTVLIFRLKDFALCQDLYGHQFADEIETLLVETLRTLSDDSAQGGPHVLRLGPGEMLVLLTLCPASEGAIMDQLFEQKLNLQARLRKKTIAAIGREFEIEAGCAIQKDIPRQNREMAFHATIDEARRMATGNMDYEKIKLLSQFRSIMKERQVRTLFQPIFDFKSGAIMAFEALSRGPHASTFQSPAMLFDAAEQFGELFHLEQLCRTRAIETVGPLTPGQRLFLNIHPRTVVDPGFTPGTTLELLQQHGLEAENIVFEITERHSIKDFTLFHKTLDHYRSQGFRIAIDDAGTGYSGLSTIAALQPDFIKVDMSLVRDVDKDPVRRALMETMVTLSERIGSEIVAEGIESKAEAMALMDIGVHYGQGYFLSRPQFPKPETPLEIREISPVNPDSLGRLSCSIPIGQLSKPAMTISPRTPVHSVQRMFATNPALPAVIVAEENRPVGLIMSYSLDRHLATLYGRALYADKPISVLMDSTPMIVDHHAPVESVAKDANAREMLKAYDEVVVTRDGEVLGMVSVQNMLSTLAQVQVEMAKGTNPLTGLPGNVALEKEIEQRLRRAQPFCMLYADLDHFKVYNDIYGFKDGDVVILLLGRIMAWAMGRHGQSGDFLAHIGGDDFVGIASPERAERICKSIVRCFKRLIPNRYHDLDRCRGWITGKARDGREQRFPLVSVSIGIVDCQSGTSLQTLGEKAAQIKGYAKSIPGNVYVRDRRN